jgi:hypothetical protein
MRYTNALPIRPWTAIAAFFLFYQVLLPGLRVQDWERYLLLFSAGLLVTWIAGTYWGWSIGAAYVWIAFLAVFLWNYILIGSDFGWNVRLFTFSSETGRLYTAAVDSALVGLGGVVGQALLLAASRLLSRFRRSHEPVSAATREDFDQYFR